MVLEKFRLFGATKAAKALLFALILAFAAWGIESFLQAQSSPHGLEVNGEPVTLVSLETQLRARSQQIEQALGGPLTPEQRQGLQMGEQLVEASIVSAVLRQTAQAMHLQPATRRLQEEIAALPPFQNEVGQFDATRYRSALAQMGRSPAQFEREMASDLSIRNLSGLLQLAPVPEALALPQATAAASVLKLQVATLKAGPVAEAPTANQLEDFYKLNPKAYELPEVRSGQVLELSAASLSNTLSIPESRIAQEYEANQAAYNTPETREVRHILVSTLSSATALQGTIQTSDDFIREANAVSIDPGNLGTKGGSLGSIKRDDVVPGFANMAFGLPVGQLSTPVQTPFGWHLIWVDAISPASVKPLAEVRNAIREALVQAETQTMLEQLLTQVDDALAGGQSLAEVAKANGLVLRPLPRVTAADEATPPALLQALFATAVGATSAPITLENGGLAYLETTVVEPATLPPLAEIRTRVTQDWRALQAQLALKASAEALIGAARAPATGNRSLAEAAAQAGVKASIESLTLGGNSPLPRWLEARQNDLLAATPGTTFPTALANGDDLLVVQLVAREAGQPTGTPQAAQTALTQAQTQDFEAMLVTHLIQQAKVQCNEPGLRQVFGYDVRCAR